MKKKVRKIYIGVAWPYANDIFHIGHLAGAYLPPDVFSRFHKLRGNEVLMVSGTDFHGTPITVKAEQEKKKPLELARAFHKLDKEYLNKFFIEYTHYTSTHTPVHKRVVQNFFLRMLKRGFISVKKTEQLYSPKAKRFLQDRYIEGECPYCHFKSARGDQCEKCGRVLDALELINPVSKIDSSALVKKETENYFFEIGKLQKEIKKWLLSKKGFKEWVKKESLGWIKEGLKARAITRDLDYGIPLPYSKIPKRFRIKKARSKVFYVWFEAVIGYLSAAIEYSQKIKRKNYWRDFFYDKKAESYYFVGQDNLLFHTIIWPAQLLAYDQKINLPSNVFVNKFLLLENEKMSKSRKWYIETPYLLENYPAESVRFYLIYNMPEEKEFNFTWSDFVRTNNNILVGKVGNFIHRVLVLANKNFSGNFVLSESELSPAIRSKISQTYKKTAQFLEKGRFRFGLWQIINLAEFGNKYLEEKELWKKIKENPEKGKKELLNCLFIVEAFSLLLYPFLPQSAKKLRSLLGLKKISFKKEKDLWRAEEGRIKIKISQEISPLFLKIDEKAAQKEEEKLNKK